MGLSQVTCLQIFGEAGLHESYEIVPVADTVNEVGLLLASGCSDDLEERQPSTRWILWWTEEQVRYPGKQCANIEPSFSSGLLTVPVGSQQERVVGILRYGLQCIVTFCCCVGVETRTHQNE